MSATVAAVLEAILPSAVQALMADHEWDAMARVDRAIALQLATKDARIVLETVLAALTAAGKAIVDVPEGVAVAHGARLVPAPMWIDGNDWHGDSPSGSPLYAIEDAP